LGAKVKQERRKPEKGKGKKIAHYCNHILKISAKDANAGQRSAPAREEDKGKKTGERQNRLQQISGWGQLVEDDKPYINLEREIMYAAIFSLRGRKGS